MSKRSERNISPVLRTHYFLFYLLPGAAWVMAGGCNVQSKSNCSEEEEVSAANHYFQKRYLFPQVLVCRRRRRCAPAVTEIVTNGVRSRNSLFSGNFSGQSCCRRGHLKPHKLLSGAAPRRCVCVAMVWEWCRLFSIAYTIPGLAKYQLIYWKVVKYWQSASNFWKKIGALS